VPDERWELAKRNAADDGIPHMTALVNMLLEKYNREHDPAR
jgi:hypothetical protein